MTIEMCKKGLDNKAWVKIEQQSTCTHLIHLPWIDKTHRRILHNNHPVLNYAFRDVWHKVKGNRKLTKYPSPLMPVANNPAFPPALQTANYKDWLVDDHLQFMHLMTQGKLADFETLQLARPQIVLPKFQYCQIRHYYTCLGDNARLRRNITPFELLCTATQTPRCTISTLYKLLLPQGDSKHLIYIWSWKRELKLDLSEETIKRRLHILMFSSCNLFWRCHRSLGNLLCKGVLGCDIIASPAHVLLFWDEEGTENIPDRALERHLLNTAKLQIPLRWKYAFPPTPKDWLLKVDKLARFEELLSFYAQRTTNFRDVWLRWFLFRDTEDYKQILGS
ncbi:hypothetical protein XELAEV_18044948mg [Xenopus laevis]|uniref:Uncharacterized protein n=1 Tax=Xenopus laevis TaxID=8355 RepID=A0A974BZU4_XENLA|nr:hypothetical protein XELAEV_18044948mg [Xenopus laevis]